MQPTNAVRDRAIVEVTDTDHTNNHDSLPYGAQSEGFRNDAIQMATAISQEAAFFLTNDERLQRDRSLFDRDANRQHGDKCKVSYQTLNNSHLNFIEYKTGPSLARGDAS
ncbi:MAG: hypothetical protein SVX43_23475 [Cyanobacteriota bacterium]|nr:hypothetical protein [Cyanobacteriota bacterium]